MEMDKPEYSKKDVWWIVTKTAIAVFMLTMIYARFLSMEREIVTLRDDVQYTNERVDKKTSRVEEGVNKNKSEIDKLKLPNTDK